MRTAGWSDQKRAVTARFFSVQPAVLCSDPPEAESRFPVSIPADDVVGTDKLDEVHLHPSEFVLSVLRQVPLFSKEFEDDAVWRELERLTSETSCVGQSASPIKTRYLLLLVTNEEDVQAIRREGDMADVPYLLGGLFMVQLL